MSYYMLALLYTYNCCASCDICTYYCAPKREEKMELEEAMRYVREGKELGMRMLGVAGGEPLLYLDEILELSSYANGLGMNITLTSNGYWGSSFDRAYVILDALRNVGVRHIKISSDEFHGRYIPYENIANVLNAAKELQVKIVLGCTSLKNSSRLKGLLEHIQDAATGVILMEQTCYPIGRAREMFRKEDFIRENRAMTSCRDSGMLIVTPEGNVYPCGSMCSNVPGRLTGSLAEQSMASLIERAEQDRHNRFIRKHGVQPYYDYIKEHNIPIPLEENLVDTCHACYELFRDERWLPELDKVVERLESAYGAARG
ncbi:radical SAM protein [Paenibacillus sp. alder61]|uniref:Radical SAM protein n=1 Tax=Paenibacillus faecis TaxID=862114 RepID=A0A5D0CQY8_9BACL|nr:MULTISPECIES: radical SAM protein [Paenibacillus]MCA1292283.1 radical SAM protein [Paenibacillus sp. alder61]TYA11187.1 radical SAM protein [Paenibacillus faecis]